MIKRRFLFFSLLFVLLTVQLFYFFISEPIEERPAISQNSQTLYGLHVLGSDEHQRNWEVYSEEASYDVGKKFILKKVEAHLFFDKEIPFKILADRGALHPFKKDFGVEGNVQIESGNNYRFFTDSAYYFSDKRVLKTDEVFVRGLEKGSVSLEGKELSADLNKNYVEIKSPLLSSKQFRIKGEKGFFKNRRRRLYFSNNVEVELKKFKITAKEAFLDYENKNFKPHSLSMNENVRLTAKNIWAVSEKMKIDLSKRKYTFEGKPRLLYHYNELKGEKIIFYEESEKLEVIKGQLELKRGLEGNE